MCDLRLTLSFALGVLLLWGSPSAAQVTVSPDTVRVTLEAGERAEVVLTVSNAADSSGFALSLAPKPSADDPPEPPGTLLFATDFDVIDEFSFDLTQTPDGHLFVADDAGRKETTELTAELAFVQEFEHPITMNGSSTGGITYNADTGTLWWLDIQRDEGFGTAQALLLEGSLDGEPTGRELAVPYPDSSPCGYDTGRPGRPVYEAATDSTKARVYYLDVFTDEISAIDTLGRLADGYPVPMTDYAGVPYLLNPEGCLINGGLDAHALGNAPGEKGEPVFEVLMGVPRRHPRNRSYTVVVTDREGRNRGAETSLFDLPPPDGFDVVRGIRGVVRSRLDPTILYLNVDTGPAGFARDWVYAVRASPLPPVWLHASPILFAVDAPSEREVVLSLDASALALGVYEAVVAVQQEDGVGLVVAEVPVVLTVAPPVAAEGGPGAPPAVVLGEPYPNPSDGSVTVPLVLGSAAAVRLVVYDVTGREVARLADGALHAGEHEFALDGSNLPSGVYLVRLQAGGTVATERVTVLR